MRFLRDLFAIEKKPRTGLLPVEWAVVAYTLATLLLMVVLWTRLVDPQQMLWCRFQALAMMAGLWAVYRMVPCRLTHFARAGCQMVLLGLWYPDTYEFNRLFNNLDHHFAQAEQTIFGFQPALVFAEKCSHPVVSELLSLGYASYYPLIALVVLYFFFCRYREFDRAVFVIVASFFLFYVVFICLPVAGPQYYYLAIGLDQAAQGVFPAVGHYFEHHQESLPIPGESGGVFHQLVVDAHVAGERPTAAFPSSHVGVTVVLLWLVWHASNRRLLLLLLPFAVLMFFATFYIQAHYAIDALAGIVAGTVIYFVCLLLYRPFQR